MLDKFKLAHPLESTERDSLRSQLSQLREGAARQRPGATLVPDYPDMIRDHDRAAVPTGGGHANARRIGQGYQSRTRNPYPKYRDINVLPLALACVAAPDSAWVARNCAAFYARALDQEGKTFAFDLASVLRLRAEERGLAALELAQSLDKALVSKDRWGTDKRAQKRTSHCPLLAWANDASLRRVEKFAQSRAEATRPFPNAGYEVITFLSLANRCHEFGKPSRADDWKWLEGNLSFLEMAEQNAQAIFDPQFCRERIMLLNAYSVWRNQPTPDIDMALATLAQITDHDTRLAYIDHVSARWSAPDRRNPDGVKALIPLALMDATTLDALLGRLVGAALDHLSDEDVTEAIRISRAL